MRHGWWLHANLPLLVVAGLVYDNGLLAAGHLIGTGPLLEGLNLARFWIHALVLIVVVVGAMLWKKERWPWLLVGAVVMTVGGAVQLPVASGAVTNAFEPILLGSIIATKVFQDSASVPVVS